MQTQGIDHTKLYHEYRGIKHRIVYGNKKSKWVHYDDIAMLCLPDGTWLCAFSVRWIVPGPGIYILGKSNMEE